MLVQTVLDTLYDLHKTTLHSSTIEREVKKHVHHVVTSLIPNESARDQSKRSSYISERSSLLEASPFGRDPNLLSESSLLGTPSSIGTMITRETKRVRTLPSLPSLPTDL